MAFHNRMLLRPVVVRRISAAGALRGDAAGRADRAAGGDECDATHDGYIEAALRAAYG
jgi:hypothetical protein